MRVVLVFNQIKSLLILLTFGFICQNFGPISDDLGGVLTLILLVVYFFTTVPVKIGDAVYVAVFVIFSVFVSRLSNDIVQLSGLVAFLFGLWLFSRWRGYSTREHVISLLVTVFFTFVLFLYQYLPECWYITRLYASLFSHFCGLVYVRTLNLGHTSIGFFIVVSFIIYHLVTFTLNKERSAARLGLAILYLLCANVIFVGINLLVVFILRYTFILGLDKLHAQFLLFLLLCPSILFQGCKDTGLSQKISLLSDRGVYKFAIPTAVVFAISVVLYTFPIFSTKPVDTKNIVFYKKGSLDWDIPRFGSYGQRSGGMFGIMPKYLGVMGFNVQMVDEISIATLSRADVLVMINLNKELRREEVVMIWNFVRGGGGLLLLGDHTNLDGLMNNFNQILRMVNIRFKFDSAMPSRYVWDYLMEIRPHPVSDGFHKALSQSWWVGASLECRYPAIPLVIGKYCFSDWGYEHDVKNAYLGNRRFDYYEPLGDLVLAAYARYGKGQVLAFGDTSSFHNTTFMMTHDFVLNVFDLLSSKQDGLNQVSRHILQAFLVLAIAACVVFTFRGNLNLLLPLIFILIMCLTALSSGSGWRYTQTQKQIESNIFNALKVAYIDYSHKGRFDLMSWEDDSIGGLRNNLLRNGFFPLLLSDFDPEKILRSKLLVLIAPTQPFSAGEIGLLREFVEGGGKLLISVGWEEKDASLRLLDSFGLGLDNVPLGWCSSEYKATSVQFHEAWPVIFNNDARGVEVICKPLGFPAIVSKRYGKGSILLIADSYFLLNENLEGSKAFSVPNIFLLRDLLLK